MNRIKHGIERRQHPRIDHQLPLKLAVNGYDFVTSTQNVSCTGAYCQVNKYVPPFTRVMVKLVLPIVENGSKKEHHVECTGVVVRSEDQHKAGFNIAIFFNKINEPQKKVISQYVSQFIPKENTCLSSKCNN
jgi:hypothetical protein